jgi:hypothetical protein
LSETAAAIGVNRSTLFRAYKAGRMGATRLEIGQIEVDPAELFRVFPPHERLSNDAAQPMQQGAPNPHATPDIMAESSLRNSALEVEVKLLREMLLRSSSVSALFAAAAARHLSASFVPSPHPDKSIALEAATGLAETRTADASGRQI